MLLENQNDPYVLKIILKTFDSKNFTSALDCLLQKSFIIICEVYPIKAFRSFFKIQ
jgi:hypothetical protein